MEQRETIMVSGAAGYLASWIVAQLLEQGYRVHATVRDLQDHSKLQHLEALSIRYPGALQLFAADLLQPGSFDRAMTGCSVVIHTASPYFLERPREPGKQLIDPALEGTRNVLQSVNRCGTVKRVVLTSSVVALYNDACDLSASLLNTVQEEQTNANQDSSHNTYAYSKTVAEQAAWELCGAQSRWDMVTIHPGAIFGPSLSKRVDATSVSMMMQFLNGTFRGGVPRLWLGVVDVRDVATAHVQAALLPHARGRYIVAAKSLSLLAIAQCLEPQRYQLRNRLPRREIPKPLIWLIAPLVGMQRRYVARNVNFPIHFNNQRSIEDLGLEYRAVAKTLDDHMAQLVADGLL